MRKSMKFFISSKATLDVNFEVEANSKGKAMDKFRSGFFDYWDIPADVLEALTSNPMGCSSCIKSGNR